VSVAPGHRAPAHEAPGGSSETALDVEQYWTLLHDLMNQLTTTRLYTQRLLGRMQNGEAPSDTEWREGLACIDRAAVSAVELIKQSVGTQVVKLPYVTAPRSRVSSRRGR
jgi:hypothetical protein